MTPSHVSPAVGPPGFRATHPALARALGHAVHRAAMWPPLTTAATTEAPR